QRHAVPPDRLDLTIGAILAEAWSEQDHTRQRRPTTHSVDDGGAREVVEPPLAEPASTPLPEADDGIDQGHVYGREPHEAVELDAFGDSPRDDGGGGGGEHGLEEEVGPVGGAGVVGRGESSCVGGDAEAAPAHHRAGEALT